MIYGFPVDSSCRLWIVPLFHGSSRFENLILPHHSRFNVTCASNKEEINDDDERFLAHASCFMVYGLGNRPSSVDDHVLFGGEG